MHALYVLYLYNIHKDWIIIDLQVWCFTDCESVDWLFLNMLYKLDSIVHKKYTNAWNEMPKFNQTTDIYIMQSPLNWMHLVQ